jgi:hypothetical protein
MSAPQVAEARAMICSALADLGGVCERLRDIEAMELPAVHAESWEDILNWTGQAREELAQVGMLAANMRERAVFPQEEARP